MRYEINLDSEDIMKLEDCVGSVLWKDDKEMICDAIHYAIDILYDKINDPEYDI